MRVVGEGVLIVTSILLAFGIQAWWDGKQEARHRRELIAALQLDFEATREKLSESIALGESLVARSRGFLAAAVVPRSISLDSLGMLSSGAFRALEFEPALSSYEGAVATGDLSLVQTTPLLDALTEFGQAHGYFAEHSTWAGELFYLGASFNLRREMGSQEVLEIDSANVPAAFQLSEGEYWRLAGSREMYAAVQTTMMANSNMLDALQRMDRAAQSVLAELEGME